MIIIILVAVLGAGQVHAESSSPNSVFDLTLEELLTMDVTSVAGVEQSLMKTPAAMFVITSEDIARSGMQSLPEVLRMVPGMQVAQLDSGAWAVSSRGFNGRFANKLLVLIDGRSVYNPFYSGVYWDLQEIILADVDRIEVIRGPGATLWGANAVNGVINVTTKSAKDTQGGLVHIGGGTLENATTSLRYGDKLGDNLYFRGWGKFYDRDNLTNPDKQDRHDDRNMFRGGMRIDWDATEKDLVTVEAEAYGSDRIGSKIVLPDGTPYTEDQHASGHYILGRWKHTTSETSGTELQAYWDVTRRKSISAIQDKNTGDLDFRHHFQAGESHAIIWGAKINVVETEVSPDTSVSWNPKKRRHTTTSAFIQDTIQLAPDSLSLMLGTKYEHNTHTGTEWQPSGRLTWTIDDRNMAWASISRSVRTPSLLDDDFRQTRFSAGPVTGTTEGNTSMQSEELLAYEIGYRTILSENITVDSALFYNDYENLAVTVPSADFTIFNQSLIFMNDQSGQTYGGEVSITWQATDQLDLSGTYSYLQIQLHGSDEVGENSSPQNQATLMAQYKLTENLKFHANAYYTDAIVPENSVRVSPDQYIRLDLGARWQMSENLEFAVWGRNLLDPSHPEFDDRTTFEPAEIPRSVYASLTFTF